MVRPLQERPTSPTGPQNAVVPLVQELFKALFPALTIGLPRSGTPTAGYGSSLGQVASTQLRTKDFPMEFASTVPPFDGHGPWCAIITRQDHQGVRLAVIPHDLGFSSWFRAPLHARKVYAPFAEMVPAQLRYCSLSRKAERRGAPYTSRMIVQLIHGQHLSKYP